MAWSPVVPPIVTPPHALDYAEIFNARGRAYHEAMQRWPEARVFEFSQAVTLADLRAGDCVCDYPSGGGYLSSFLNVPVRLVLLESSSVFLECTRANVSCEQLLVDQGEIPLPAATVDRVISIAGLHHVADKNRLFLDVHRCLKPGGRLVIADVFDGSAVGRFLNEFVHENSDEGHQGIFLGDDTASDLARCGYEVTFAQRLTYPWQFPSLEAMVEFCRLLFGLRRASSEGIASALQSYLGFEQRDGRFLLNWELFFLAADKR